MADERTDIVVIGGGLIGAACAATLSRSGVQVTLIDPAAPREAASFGNAGHIATEQVEPLASPATLRAAAGYLLQADAPLALAARHLPAALPWLMRFAWASRPSAYRRGTAALSRLQAHALPDLTDLLESVDAPHLLHQRGHMVMFEDESLRSAKDEIDRCELLGVVARRASADQVMAVENALGRTFRHGVHFPETAHVDDPEAVRQALLAGFLRNGGQWVRARALGVERVGADYEVTCSQGSIRASRLVVAAGAWSAPFMRQLGLRAPLEVERGYHVTFPTPETSPPMPVAFAERKVIMTPMSVGLRMTGFVEFAGTAAPPSPRRFATLRRHMREVGPNVAAEPSTEWMGFRPSLPDHLPALGPVPGHPGVLCAFGHQHLGLTLSGVTARIIADLVLRGETSTDLHPFRPDRF